MEPLDGMLASPIALATSTNFHSTFGKFAMLFGMEKQLRLVAYGVALLGTVPELLLTTSQNGLALIRGKVAQVTLQKIGIGTTSTKASS